MRSRKPSISNSKNKQRELVSPILQSFVFWNIWFVTTFFYMSPCRAFSSGTKDMDGVHTSLSLSFHALIMALSLAITWTGVGFTWMWMSPPTPPSYNPWCGGLADVPLVHETISLFLQHVMFLSLSLSKIYLCVDAISDYRSSGDQGGWDIEKRWLYIWLWS